jgi:NADP-dependent 3-hydroxy acid dehydrogenase YdfG
VEKADIEQWRSMYDSNVLGVVRVTQALLPKLRASGGGHIVVLGSIAGFEVYPGGAGYTGVKHAVNALCRTLRLELVGEPIRITEVAPGLVETEFSLVRFGGDAERAASVYAGLTPLTAEDVADVIAFCVTRPAHVDVDHVVLKPVAQASATVTARREEREE